MKLARFLSDGDAYLGELDDDVVKPIVRASDRPGVDLVQRYLAGERGSFETVSRDATHLLAPLERPSKIVCVGLNYLDHCRETGQAPPDVPVLFAKFPNCIIGPGQAIEVDTDVTRQVDFEIELAVVIGTRARHLRESDALDCVLGYAVSNDVSARDLQLETSQWTRGKTLDGFLPLGPWITTADEIPEPQSLRLTLEVDGTVYQDSNTAEMIFPVHRLLAFITQTMTLEPGDLVLTGTPWGVGMAREPAVYLQPGNRMRLEIERLGVLENSVEAAPSEPERLPDAAGVRN